MKFVTAIRNEQHFIGLAKEDQVIDLSSLASIKNVDLPATLREAIL